MPHQPILYVYEKSNLAKSMLEKSNFWKINILKTKVEDFSLWLRVLSVLRVLKCTTLFEAKIMAKINVHSLIRKKTMLIALILSWNQIFNNAMLNPI